MLKRSFDFIIALILLIITSPIFLLCAILIKSKLGTPVLFKQERPGLNGRLFTLYKFRTMIDKFNDIGELLPDGARLTSLGHILRRWSLDEIPQLWNVLKGDVSLVGPRPLLEEYLPLYSPEQARRHEVKPGITGWAQVNGRNALSWEEKFALDVWYVDNRSFWLDLKILGLTVTKVLKNEGINQQGQATMEKFRGMRL
jgi:sugar transferase EpsL